MCRYLIPKGSSQSTEEISQVKTGQPKWERQHLVVKGAHNVYAPPHPRFQCCGFRRAINLRYFRCSNALVALIFSCVQLAIFPLFARPCSLDKNAGQVNIEIGGAGVLRCAYTATACALTCDISSVNSSILSGLALMLLQERSDDVAMATAMAMAMDWPWPPP